MTDPLCSTVIAAATACRFRPPSLCKLGDSSRSHDNLRGQRFCPCCSSGGAFRPTVFPQLIDTDMYSSARVLLTCVYILA